MDGNCNIIIDDPLREIDSVHRTYQFVHAVLIKVSRKDIIRSELHLGMIGCRSINFDLHPKVQILDETTPDGKRERKRREGRRVG